MTVRGVRPLGLELLHALPGASVDLAASARSSTGVNQPDIDRPRPGGTEFVAAAMMAAMFAVVFIVADRDPLLGKRLEWLAEAAPYSRSQPLWLDTGVLPADVGLDRLLGQCFLHRAPARSRDRSTSSTPMSAARRAKVVRDHRRRSASASGCFSRSGRPGKSFYILRLKKTATLSSVFGDWIRVRDVYSIYFAFLVIVAARYAWRAWDTFKHGAEADLHHYDELAGDGGAKPGEADRA